MALYSKKEFAKLCGITPGNLSNYEKRGKVVYTGDNVDDTNIHNKEFLAKRQRAIVHKSVEERVPEPQKTSPKIDQGEEKVSPKQKSLEFDDGTADLDRKQRQLDLQKTEAEIALLNLKEAKQRGEMIPVDMVQAVFAQHTKTILVEYNNSTDKILTKIAKKKSMSNEEVSEVRREIMHEINLAVDRSIDESKKNIKSIVDEFSEKKGRGERN